MVVAIIALLIGILLPALGEARRVAQRVACMAHLKGAGQGVQTYISEWRGYYPGPNTSGWQITREANGYTFSDNPSEPVQNTDWISPTLGESLGMPEDLDERIAAMFNHEFKCPSNGESYDGQFGSGGPSVDPTTLTVSSYSAAIGFHMYENNPGTGALYANSWLAVDLPRDVRFKVSAVGPPSTKVFAMDGARYVDYDTGEITYNAFNKQVQGGNYMNYSPAVAENLNNGTPYKRSGGELSEPARRFAYRHGDALNAVYFDGHAESLDEAASRPVKLYFPSKSVINSADDTDDPDDVDGQVIE